MSRLASEQAKASSALALGLYVHVPFCASTCDFCAFYQTQPTADGVERFQRGIADETRLVAWTRPVTTVFWGGGTPGLLAPGDLEALALEIRRVCRATPEEWTVELAPASVTDSRLAVLKTAGVTRISLGVQSFQPALLDALGRAHSVEQVYRAYERIQSAGFASVNLDLMFALPGQTAEEWAKDVRAAVSLAPNHISTYCLTFEEDTKLWVKLSQGRVKLDIEHEAKLYEATWAQLAAADYAQYEISNFARPGHACRHNLNTWRMNEWIGLGPSAASQYAGVRGANIANLDQWLDRLARGERVTEDRVTVTPELLAADALIFGLRTNAGVDLAGWRKSAPEAPWPLIEDTLATLASGGLLVHAGDNVSLTDRGRLIADTIGVEVMAAFESTAETVRR